MSKIYWSAKTLSFYPEELYYRYKECKSLPEDIIEIDRDIFSTYSGQPPEGKTRSVLNGMPAWGDLPVKEVSITDIAEAALIEIRTYLNQEYLMMNLAIPQEYVDYQKKLKSVISGESDTLPEKPNS